MRKSPVAAIGKFVTCVCERGKSREKRREEKRREETARRPNKEKRAKRDFLQFHFRCATTMSQEDVIFIKEITKMEQQRPSSPTSTLKNEKAVNDKNVSINGRRFGGSYSVTYPIDRRRGAVEITTTDLDYLDPTAKGNERKLKDNAINYHARRFVGESFSGSPPETTRERIHVLSSFFFSRLKAPGYYENVKTWIKGINIFKDKDFILIPIHGKDHWSLAIVTYPGSAVEEGRTSENLPCIIHLDSMGRKSEHTSLDVSETLMYWLQCEYNRVESERTGNVVEDGATLINDKTMRSLNPSVPLQNNGFDCGVFVLLYIHKFVQNLPEKFTLADYNSLNPNLSGGKDSNSLTIRLPQVRLFAEKQRRENSIGADYFDIPNTWMQNNCPQMFRETWFPAQEYANHMRIYLRLVQLRDLKRAFSASANLDDDRKRTIEKEYTSAIEKSYVDIVKNYSEHVAVAEKKMHELEMIRIKELINNKANVEAKEKVRDAAMKRSEKTEKLREVKEWRKEEKEKKANKKVGTNDRERAKAELISKDWLT